MLRVFFPLFALIVLSTSVTNAQRAQVTGIVLDSVSQEPLVGANILFVGTRTGTTTNSRGHFSIGIDPGRHILRCTFVGYAAAETTVSIASMDSVWLSLLLSPVHIESEVVVVTATRTLRSIADVPVRVEAIPEEEVEEKLLMTPSNVGMLLNESTGMRVQTTSAATNTANLRIQGLSGRYTQILTDGIPSLGGLSAGLSLTQLVPLDLRQVEVLKGATSALYGADAIGGVVNFLPKRPGAIREVNLLFNATTQRGFDFAGFVSEQLGRAGLSLLVSRNLQDRYDVDGDGFADVARFERLTVTPRLSYRLSDNFSARLGLNILKESRKGGEMNETPLPGSSAVPYIEKINTDRLDVSSHIDWRPTPEQSVSAKLAWLRSRRDAAFGANPFNAVQDVYFGDAQFSIDLSPHSVLIGSALRVDDFLDRTPGVPSSRSYRFIVPSFFLQDEIHAAEGMTFLASGRIDFHNVYGTFLVPRLSLMYKPTSSITFRLGAGTGYKAPTIFVEEAEEVGFRNLLPLKNTKPEKARSGSFDLNWRTILGPMTLDCNSALFFTSLNDALLADADSLQAGVLYLRNATGALKSVGTELSLRLTYDDLKVSLGYTYLYATQDDLNETTEIELNPRHSVGMVFIWERTEIQTKVGLETYWTGRQRIERNPFRTTTPAYWVTGLIAEKGFGNFRLFINLENIFDTRQTRYDPIFQGNLRSGNLRILPIYAPLEGRVINAGIRFVLKPNDSN